MRDSPGPGDGHQREHHARQLAAGGGVADRRGRHPGVGRQHQLGALGAARPDLVARLEPHLEGRVLHRQRGQLLAGRARRAAAPPPGAARRAPRASSSRSSRARRQLGLGALGGDLGLLEPLALGAAALGVRQHRRDAAAVLALEPVVLLEALLDLLQAARLGLERVGVAAQLAAEVLGLDPQGRQPPASSSSSGSTPRTAPASRSASASSSATPPVGAVRGDRLRAAARGRQQAVHLPQPLALGAERRPFLLGRVERLDLLDLEGEQVEVAVARAGPLAQLVELALELLDAGVRGRQPAAQRELLATAEAVEQVELRRGEREPAVLVLAEERDQPAAERLQVGGRGRAAPRRTRACGPRR